MQRRRVSDEAFRGVKLFRQISLFLFRAYAVLAPVSQGYPPPKGRLPTCYSPVRHFTRGLLPFLVRLACVKRAASVDSEPGSNSRLNQLSPRSTGRPERANETLEPASDLTTRSSFSVSDYLLKSLLTFVLFSIQLDVKDLCWLGQGCCPNLTSSTASKAVIPRGSNVRGIGSPEPVTFNV